MSHLCFDDHYQGSMEMEEDFSSSEELSSDEELQEEFCKGTLVPGIIVRRPPLKVYTNNVAGMKDKLAELQKNRLDWIERMDVVAPADSGPTEEGEGEGSGEGPGSGSGMDTEDDFKREMHFYYQAQSSALAGLRQLDELGVPTQRPEDYYAEMVKNDDHMRRVRQNLLSRQKVLEQREKARKLRELKKYGKKVQQEILQKRREEKKATLEAVKKYTKRGGRARGERPSFLGRDAGEELEGLVGTESVSAAGSRGQGKAGGKKGQGAGAGGGKRQVAGKSVKRAAKDKKFGFGGKKRWAKTNTAESSADMSAFNPAKHSRKTGGGRGKGGARGGAKGGAGRGKRGKLDLGKRGKSIRLGKSRRQKNKMKLKR